MSRVYIPAELRHLVCERARWCCEYCLLHQDDADAPHQFDHLIALKHDGRTVSENLALACQLCNRYKGSDLAAIDPLTGAPAWLFNPRQQKWHEHFELVGARIIGLTPAGRATVEVLRLNAPSRLIDRQSLLDVGRYPLV